MPASESGIASSEKVEKPLQFLNGICIDCSQTVHYFFGLSLMSIVESDGPPSWFLDASETGESTKCPWVGVMELKAWGRGGRKQ